MKRYILGIDPGLATGWGLIDCIDPDTPVVMESLELTVEEFFDKIEETIKTYGSDLVIVVENFLITERTGKLTQQPFSLWLIGVCMYLGYKYDVEIVLQKPAEKPFATNERLRVVGFWHVGAEGHANDAFRHLMIYLANKNPRWVRKLVVPSK